jgi:hypothetical protein
MITTEKGTFSRILFVLAVLIIVDLAFYFGTVSAVLALPTTGAAGSITSNSASFDVVGITGTDVWIEWGQNPGGEIWNTPNATASGGVATVFINGSPLLGGTLYYAKACDSSGCDITSPESSFTTVPVTPVPVTQFGTGYRNLTATRFNPVLIGGTLFKAYTNIMPSSVVFGMLFGVIVIGMWQRTKSVRLVSILMMIASPFIVLSNAGLMLGVPLAEQALGQVLLALGFAGVALSFIKP